MRRKWIKRIIFLLILGVILWLIAYLLPDKRINGLYLIPSDAIYILESNDPLKAWNAMSSSQVWKSVKDHPLFADITDDADYLDNLIAENPILTKLFGKRQLYLSAHPTSRRNYDFLFLVDVKRSAQPAILYTALEKVLRNDGFKVTRRAFENHEILEVEDRARDKLSVVKVDNFLLCSYTPQIVENAIRQKANPFFGIDYDFDEVYKQVAGRGMNKLYVQWQYLDEYLSCYFLNGKSFAAGLDEAMLFSALELEMEPGSWQLKGVTSLNPDRQSYLKALLNSGSSELRLPSILPNRTAWYVSFNFNSMSRFYEELLANLELFPAKNKEFTETRDRIEKLLDISIERNLIEWIGEEVGIAQIQPANLGKSEEDLVIFLRTKDLDLARKRLNEITQQVKKRTPAKFKSLAYKNYQIEYLAIKGVFKILFGNLFDKIEKPYFTILGDYVLFSNSPLTIIGCIEDFENNRILANSPTYQDAAQNIERSSFHAFIAPSRTRNLLSKHLDQESRNGLNRSAKYIDAFSSFVLDLRADGDVLGTRLRLVQSSERDSAQVQLAEIKGLFETFMVDVSAGNIQDSSLFRVQYIEDNMFKKFYPASEQLEIEAEMKDGKKNGTYTEYYPNGTLRVSGKYRRDQKTGLWKYYDESGELSKRKRY
ncbi:MAG: DUF3352 domain-containing protein [Flavobacteriales bacterium]|nr:DUF3352 domain-containing protein [Flavobacteriales bacterium]